MAVRHRVREQAFLNAPYLISTKVVSGLPSLRRPEVRDLVLLCLRAAMEPLERLGMRVLEFAILSNHLHFVVQVRDNEALSRGVQGLLIRIARGVNRVLGRKGKVFLERFHSSLLKRAWDVWKAVRYVVQNGRKHGIPLPADRPDPYTSGPWFRCWDGRAGKPFDPSEPPVARMVSTINFLERAYYTRSLRLTELPGPRSGVPAPMIL